MKKTSLVAALLLLCALAGSVRAEEKPRIRKLPRATLRELAAIALPPPPPRERRHEEPRVFGEHTRDGRGISTEAEPARVTTTATIAPPPIAVAFPSDSTTILGPADASGAVSKTHVVGASNIGITVFSRTGTRLVSATLGQFWNGSGGSFLDEVYDPRVVYDTTANRWITVAVKEAKELLVAVTATGDPTGTWNRYSISIGGCDFTRLALTRDTILVGTLIDDATYSEILSIRKTELYAAATDLNIETDFFDGDAVPVHGPESQAEYVVSSGDSALRVRRIDIDSSTVYFDAGFSWHYPFDDMSPAGVTRALSIGFGDVQAAMLRDGWLYAVHRIGSSNHSPDGNALLWWKVDPTSARPHELGVIDSPTGTVYAYPSLAVNRKGGMVLSFCTFSATTFPSASFIYRDPAGRVSTPRVIATGDSRVSGTDRWGDYTTVVEDPNGHDFWITQIRATRNSWETSWSNVKVPLPRARGVRH